MKKSILNKYKKTGVYKYSVVLPRIRVPALNMKLRKFNNGNFFGYFKGYYFYAYRKSHGGLCCRIGKAGEWLYFEGMHACSLPNVKKVKWWVNEMLTNPQFKTRIWWDKIWKGTEKEHLIPQ